MRKREGAEKTKWAIATATTSYSSRVDRIKNRIYAIFAVAVFSAAPRLSKKKRKSFKPNYYTKRTDIKISLWCLGLFFCTNLVSFGFSNSKTEKMLICMSIIIQENIVLHERCQKITNPNVRGSFESMQNGKMSSLLLNLYVFASLFPFHCCI